MKTSDMTYAQIQRHVQAGRTLRAHALRDFVAALFHADRPATPSAGLAEAA